MEMIGNQGPGITLGLGFDYQIAKPRYEIVSILIISEYLATLDSPGNNMMNRTWSVYSGLSRHAVILMDLGRCVNIKI